MNINPETAEHIVLSDKAFDKLEEIINDPTPAKPSPALVALLKARNGKKDRAAVEDGPGM